MMTSLVTPWEIVELGRLLEAHLLWHDGRTPNRGAIEEDNMGRQYLARFWALARPGTVTTDIAEAARRSL